MIFIPCLFISILLGFGGYIDDSWVGYFFAVIALSLGIIGEFIELPFNPIGLSSILVIIYALFFKKP